MVAAVAEVAADDAPAASRGPVRGPLTGVGIGWRPEIDPVVRSLPGLAWCEVVAESVHPPDLPAGLAALRDAGIAIVPHGVRLSLGSAADVDADRLRHFAEVAAAVDAPIVSEHIAFVRSGGVEAGHLLPLPRSREAVDAMVRNAVAVQRAVGVPIALEPIAAVFNWPEAELTEGQFISEIVERADCRLLLDVANVYANALNAGTDPAALFDQIPLDRIAYVHVAGGDDRGGVYHDTHTDPVPAQVLELLAQLMSRPELAGRAPAVMLERDGCYPPAGELLAELDAIADAAGQPRVTPTAAPQ